MTPRDEIIKIVTDLYDVVKDTKHIKGNVKSDLRKEIDHAIEHTPVGTCSSPDVVLGIHILRDIHMNMLKLLMNTRAEQVGSK